MKTVSVVEGNLRPGERQVIGSGTSVTKEQAYGQTGQDLTKAPELRPAPKVKNQS